MDRFDRCLLVVNPHGTSYRRSLKLRTSLEKNFVEKVIVTVRLTRNELEKPVELRKELRKMDKNSLLAIIGGDGTMNFVISELLKFTPAAPKNATVLPLWGGNASDLAHMLNGRRRNSVRQILRKGKRISVRPIEYALTHGKKEQTGFAMCYLSFGSVALTARAYDRSRFVRLTAKIPIARLLTEVGVGSLALTKARKFKVAEHDRKVYDLIYINGPRIAKLYRAPAKLTRTGFLELRVFHKHPAPVIHSLNMLRVWIARPGHSKRASFRLEEPAWMQADGEVSRVEAETAVRIEPARQSVYLLATK